MRKKPAFFTTAIALGDALCSTPTIRKLAEVYGEPVRVFSYMPEVFENLPYVSGVEDMNLWKDPERERWLRETYDLHYTFAKMGKKIQASDGRGIEMRHSQMDIRQYHATDLGFNLLPNELHCDFTPKAEMSLELPEKFICLHASKTWSSRSWSDSNWKELTSILVAEGMPVVVVGKDGMSQEDIQKYIETNLKAGFDGVEQRLLDELSTKKVNAIDVAGIIDLSNKTDLSQLWHVLNKAHCVVTMDSGILHVAGTTDSFILQLGSSINPGYRAPYRRGIQSYRYAYLGGSCNIFCASNMKYSLRDWQEGYNGGTPIQSLSLVDTCLEKKKTFECHPSVEQVAKAIRSVWNENYNKSEVQIQEKKTYRHPEFVPLRGPEFRVKFKADYRDGAKLEVIGDTRDPRNFLVKFIDEETGDLVHESTIRTGYWTSPAAKDAKWKIEVWSGGELMYENRKPVIENAPEVIEIASASLGDTIGALAMIDQYRKNTGKKVDVICNHRNVFHDSYPEMKLYPQGTEIDENMKIKGKEYSDYRKIYYKFEKPLMAGYGDQLGVSEIPKTKIDKKRNERPMKQKYFCFSMHSTAQAKHWNNPEGWNKLCDLMKAQGITPVCIDRTERYGTEGYWNKVPNNCVRKLGLTLKEAIRYIQHAEFFVGLSSGLSWVANALDVPTVVISNVTTSDHEFFGENVIRISDESVCHGCFHVEQFDAGDWLWCPRNKDTENQFVCSKVITAERVAEEINEKFINKKGALHS